MTLNTTAATPSHEELEEIMICCRYGELEEVQAFVGRYGWKPMSEVRDENGNTILHMICGNGHTGKSYPHARTVKET
jgi:hypothetical protein